MSKSIKLNAFFKTLMSVVNILFPLVTAPYVARVLSTDGFTEYNRASSMLAWFAPFAVFGVYTYGMRTISQIKNNKKSLSELFSHLVCFNLISSTIVTGIFIAVVFFIPSFRNYKAIYLIVSIQLLSNFFATDYANEAFESYGFILLKSFFCRLIYVASVFCFVRKEDDVFVYFLLSILSTVLNNFLTFCYAKSKIPFSKIELQKIKKLVKPLFLVFLLVNSSMLYTIFDRAILTFFSTKLNLTYYNSSQSIMIAITGVTSSVLLVSIPRLSNLWSENRKEEYYSILKKTASSFLAFHIPCCAGLMVLCYEVFYFYCGEKYILGNITFFWFALRYMISAFDMILAKQIYLVTGNERKLAKIYYIGGIYNISCKIILLLTNCLTPELCVITTMTADILVIILERIGLKKLKVVFNLFSKQIIKYFVVSACFFPIAYLLKKIIGITSLSKILLETALTMITCVALYAIVLIATKDELIRTLPIKNKFYIKEKTK